MVRVLPLINARLIRSSRPGVLCRTPQGAVQDKGKHQNRDDMLPQDKIDTCCVFYIDSFGVPILYTCITACIAVQCTSRNTKNKQSVLASGVLATLEHGCDTVPDHAAAVHDLSWLSYRASRRSHVTARL